MPKAKKPAKSSAAKFTKKPARKPAKKIAAAKAAKPVRLGSAVPPASRLPEAAASAVQAIPEVARYDVPAASRLPEATAEQPSPQAAATKPPGRNPPRHPGKPEQPIWAKFNHGHSQKMMKGRNFRHQGR
jgi:hypothetical protein